MSVENKFGDTVICNEESSVKVLDLKEGYIKCFEESEGFDLFAETSAVTMYNDKLYIATDKSFPDRNNILVFHSMNDLASHEPFHILSDQKGNKRFDGMRIVNEINKIEDFATFNKNALPNMDNKYSEYLLMTSAFTRSDDPSYNKILYTDNCGFNDGDNFGYFNVLDIESDDNKQMGEQEHSEVLRKRIQEVLKCNYFKIEGLTVVANQLVIGIREYGDSYKNFQYSMKVLTVSINIHPAGDLYLEDDLKLALDLKDHITLEKCDEYGLSSLEYISGKMYILLSYENKESNTTSGKFYRSNLLFSILEKIPIETSHKPEGICLLKETDDYLDLFVTYDDDKVLDFPNSTREKNQSYYNIVRISKEENFRKQTELEIKIDRIMDRGE